LLCQCIGVYRVLDNFLINIIYALYLVSSVTLSPQNPSVQVASGHVFICTATVTRSGTPTFTWSQPAGSLSGQQTDNMLRSELTIQSVRLSSAGRYTCEASIGSSSMTTSTTLIATSKYKLESID